MRTVACSLAVLGLLLSRVALAESPTAAPTVVTPANGPTVVTPANGPTVGGVIVTPPPGAPPQGGVPLSISGEGIVVLYPAGNLAQPIAQCNAPCQMFAQPGPYTIQVQNAGGGAQQDLMVPPTGASIRVGHGHGRGPGRALIVVGAIAIVAAGLTALVGLAYGAFCTDSVCGGVDLDIWLVAATFGAVGVAGLVAGVVLSRGGHGPRIDVAEQVRRQRWFLGAAPVPNGAAATFGLRF